MAKTEHQNDFLSAGDDRTGKASFPVALRTGRMQIRANQFFRLGNSFRERQGAGRRPFRNAPAASAVPLTSYIDNLMCRRIHLAVVCLVCFGNSAIGQNRIGEETLIVPSGNKISLQLSDEHSFLQTAVAPSTIPAKQIAADQENEIATEKQSSLKRTGDSLLGFVSNALPTRKPAVDFSKERPTRKLFLDQKQSDQKQGDQKQSDQKQVDQKKGDQKQGNDKALEPKAVPRRDPIDLQKTLKKVGSATFLVLAGCCAFLVIAKKLGFGQGQGETAGKAANKPSIKIIETRRLAGRCHLKLIEVDDCRFLVAVDGGGVKSVQSVARSFSESLSEYEETAATTESSSPDKQLAINNVQSKELLSTKIDSGIGERLTSLIQRL